MLKKRNRLFFIASSFLLLLGVILGRIFYLQVTHNLFFKNLANRQYISLVTLQGQRGKIFDRSRRLLATNIVSYSLYIDPKIINPVEKENLISFLSELLSISEKEVAAKISTASNKRFIWLKRRLTFPQVKKVREHNFRCLGLVKDERRFYPEGRLFSHVLGMVNVDNEGLEGLELYYNTYLAGKKGVTYVLRDSHRKALAVYPEIFNPQHGCDLILTVDAQIQYWAQTLLEETIKRYRGSSGSVIVMSPGTGEIIALANYPDFDPNNPYKYPHDYIRNRAITDSFEPGSVFKIVTLAAALASRHFHEDDQIFCEHGAYKIPGSILHDWHKYGQLRFDEVFVKSSNIGVAKIATSLGASQIYRYSQKFGFGSLTGIDLKGEVKGVLKPYWKWSKTTCYIVPIGQSVAVTAIQLAEAFSIIANGGFWVRPYIVKEVYNQDKMFSKKTQVIKKRVLSSSVAKRAKNILVKVVEEGTGILVRIKGIKIAGKTGTAQKVNPLTKRYDARKYRASFVGFFPADNPQFTVCVTIDEPHRSHFGGVVAGYLFKRLVQKIIVYSSLNKEEFAFRR